jgi:pimeloyl-ACP methyl ester carboxylesterase
MAMNRRQFSTFVAATLSGCRLARGDEGATSLPNVETPTTGGLYFWNDIEFFRDWRIQRHGLTGHCRLLDEADHRLAWGALEACREKLAEIRTAKQLPPMSGEAVILMHGLNRNRRHMRDFGEYLQRHNLQVFNTGYASHCGGVDDHAQQLANVIKHLEGIEKIHFVAHSLGNLVIRRWIKLNSELPTPDERLGRIVMIGPPNKAPVMAKILGPLDFNNAITGQSGADLGRDWKKLEPNLATPEGEFGIIAGGKGDGEGWNPLIHGDDDVTVGVDETKLAGAADFRVVPVIHPNMPYDDRVQSLTRAFLQRGRFGSEAERQRIG